MNRTLAFRVAWLELVFNATPLANLWDNAASSPITQLWGGLYTADPGPGNDQTVNEIIYGAYARVAINRDGTGWTVDATSAIVKPFALISFATPTSGSGTITHFGLGKSSSGVGYLYYSGALNPNLIITVGTPPQITTDSQIQATG